MRAHTAWQLDVPILNTAHPNSEGTTQGVVGKYCFTKGAADDDHLTVRALRVYSFRVFVVIAVPAKGTDAAVSSRVAYCFKAAGLLHFAYRADREPAMVSRNEAACAIAARKGIPVNYDFPRKSSREQLEPRDVQSLDCDEPAPRTGIDFSTLAVP